MGKKKGGRMTCAHSSAHIMHYPLVCFVHESTDRDTEMLLTVGSHWLFLCSPRQHREYTNRPCTMHGLIIDYTHFHLQLHFKSRNWKNHKYFTYKFKIVLEIIPDYSIPKENIKSNSINLISNINVTLLNLAMKIELSFKVKFKFATLTSIILFIITLLSSVYLFI
jgi:hypothetical protein